MVSFSKQCIILYLPFLWLCEKIPKGGTLRFAFGKLQTLSEQSLSLALHFEVTIKSYNDYLEISTIIHIQSISRHPRQLLGVQQIGIKRPIQGWLASQDGKVQCDFILLLRWLVLSGLLNELSYTGQAHQPMNDSAHSLLGLPTSTNNKKMPHRYGQSEQAIFLS